VEIHCPEAKDMRKEERLRDCGWWADYEACTFYLRLYRRLGASEALASRANVKALFA